MWVWTCYLSITLCTHVFGVLAVQGWTTCVLLNKGMGRVLGGRAANLVSVFAAFVCCLCVFESISQGWLV